MSRQTREQFWAQCRRWELQRRAFSLEAWDGLHTLLDHDPATVVWMLPNDEAYALYRWNAASLVWSYRRGGARKAVTPPARQPQHEEDCRALYCRRHRAGSLEEAF